MQAINRYIFYQLCTATVAITVGLTFAVWLTRSLRQMDYIVNRGLPISTFFSFISLLLPSFVGIVLPIAAFCAVLFVYHKLSMDSELVVLRAAGMSQLQIARPALLLALLATAAVSSILLYFLPVTYSEFKGMQHRLRNDFAMVMLQEGTFNILSDSLTVYVRERTANGEMLGILVHDTRDPERPVTMMAERGTLVQGQEEPRVVMVNGNRQQRADRGGKVSLLYFDRYTLGLGKLRGDLRPRWPEPRERFLGELLGPSANSLNSADPYRHELRVEGHRRLVMPLYVVTFVFVALAALLSGQFNRRGQVLRVLLAVVIVALLESLALTLHDLSIRTPEAIPLMYAGTIVPTVVALVVLVRAPRRGPAKADVAGSLVP